MTKKPFPDERLLSMILDLVGAVQSLTTAVEVIAVTEGLTDKQRSALIKVTDRAEKSYENIIKSVKEIIDEQMATGGDRG